MALATDLGVLTPVVQENLAGCSLVALEANYDSFSLHGGPYPYYLKVPATAATWTTAPVRPSCWT